MIQLRTVHTVTHFKLQLFKLQKVTFFRNFCFLGQEPDRFLENSSNIFSKLQISGRDRKLIHANFYEYRFIFYMEFGHESYMDKFSRNRSRSCSENLPKRPNFLWGSHWEFLRLNQSTWIRCKIIWVANSPNKQSACSPISCQNNKLIMNLK